jgi:hypothetical protein
VSATDLLVAHTASEDENAALRLLDAFLFLDTTAVARRTIESRYRDRSGPRTARPPSAPKRGAA